MRRESVAGSQGFSDRHWQPPVSYRADELALSALSDSQLNMKRADNMENPHWQGCDFCGADNTLRCMGDVWLCIPCATKLEEEIEAVSILMEEE